MCFDCSRKNTKNQKRERLWKHLENKTLVYRHKIACYFWEALWPGLCFPHQTFTFKELQSRWRNSTFSAGSGVEWKELRRPGLEFRFCCFTGSVPLGQKFSHWLALASPGGWEGGLVIPQIDPPHPSWVSDPVGRGWGGEFAFLTGSQVVVGAADLRPKSLVAFRLFSRQ